MSEAKPFCITGQGSAAADRAGDGPAGSDTASSEDATGGLGTREGGFRFLGLHDTPEAEHSAAAGQTWWPSPKATKKLRDRVRELTESRQSGKDVKQISADLNPVLRGWGNYFRTGNADRSSPRWMASYFGDCVVGKSGEAGNGRHARRLGPAISYMEWVGIGCAARCGVRRKPHQEDHR